MVSAEAFSRFGFPLALFLFLSLPGGLESHSLHDTLRTGATGRHLRALAWGEAGRGWGLMRAGTTG